MEFLRSFLRQQFRGKPVVTSQNVRCLAGCTMTDQDFYRAQQPLESINETFKKVSYICAKSFKMTSSDTKDKCQKPTHLIYLYKIHITLGTRGFSRMRWEFSVFAEGRHIY